MKESIYNQLNPILKRQIRKMMKWDDRERIDANLMPLFHLISETYDSYEKEKKMTDHMFEISNREYEAINKKLKLEKDTIVKSIDHLLDAANEFEDSNFDHRQYSLIDLAEFIKNKAKAHKSIQVQLLKSKEIAEKASSAKSDFLATMSHEIRTPLNVIIGITHLLLSEDHSKQQAENLNVLNISADNLKMLIDDILDFNKIELGKIDFNYETHQLSDFLNTFVKANTRLANEKNTKLNLNIDKNIPKYLIFDKLRLGQCISNLISNAIKFTRDGKIDINVSLENIVEKRANLQFSIVDTGIGMSPEEIQKIFLPFEQAGPKISKNYGGTGLGLAITKKLLLLMNSELEVKSAPSIGSEFYFALGLNVEKEENFKSYSHSNLHIENLKYQPTILLVEDYTFNILYLQKLLKKENFKVITAVNGKEGVEKFETNRHIDLILMDLQMPIMDGFEATIKIRKLDKHIPIIALTASNTPEIIEKTKKIGMNDFLSKPFDPKTLKNMIYDILHSSDLKN